MPKFIKVTNHLNGQPIWINARMIITIDAIGVGTRINLLGGANGSTKVVKESVDDVLKMIDDALYGGWISTTTEDVKLTPI